MKISYTCIVIIAMTILVVQPISSETVTLRYFDIRGLAEPIRLALSYLNIDYEEVKYARCAPDCKNGLTDWTEAKKVGTESGLFAFSQVPSLTYGETSLVQSEAILRFLARKHGIAGETEIEQQRIDLFVGGLKDMRSKYGKMVYNKKALTDPKIMSDYLDVQRTWLPFFERLLVKSSVDGPYGMSDTAEKTAGIWSDCCHFHANTFEMLPSVVYMPPHDQVGKTLSRAVSALAHGCLAAFFYFW